MAPIYHFKLWKAMLVGLRKQLKADIICKDGYIGLSAPAQPSARKSGEGYDPQAAPSAHVPMQYRDQKPRKHKRFHGMAEAAPAAPSAEPRKRLGRKTAPVDTPESKRRRLNRERVTGVG